MHIPVGRKGVGMAGAVSRDELNAYLASWAGCDGGNPKGIWICGIEYGGGSTTIEEEMAGYRACDGYRQVPRGWDTACREKHPLYKHWQYHQKVAKLMLALRALRAGGKAGDSSIDAIHEYMRGELYARDGQTFKLNLYPFPSPSVDPGKWLQAYSASVGLSSKQAYYKLCADERFPFLRKQRREYEPRLIIATGKTFRDSFAEAFGFGSDYESFDVEAGNATRRCYLYADGESSLLVTPFLGGRYGLNSDVLLLGLAKEVLRRRLLN